ncbi:MAG TPA: hypothetical protein VK776_17125 [Bryobacteraceae bacterium]|nr:hypothetical protein [Bryobacteraceae bacterium]
MAGAVGRCGPCDYNFWQYLAPALMTNEQLYLAIGIPMLFNAGLFGILFAFLKAKFNSLEKRFNEKNQLEQR